MKKLLTFSVLLCVTICLQAQNMEFSIHAGGSYLPKTTTNFESETTTGSFTTINDSIFLYSTYDAILKASSINRPNPSYYINGQIKFYLSNKFAISTGWGLETLSFNSVSMNNDIIRGNLIEEQMISNSNPFGSPFLSSCDIYTNSFTDVESEIDGTNYSMIYLRIPFDLSYEIIPNLASLKAGVSLSAPIYSKAVNDYITTNRELIDDINYCTYEHLENIDETGMNINKVLLGANITLEIELTPNINIEVGTSSTFNNVFRSNSNFNNNSYDALRLNAGASYVFGNSSNE